MRNYASQRTQSQDLNNFSMFNTYSIVSYAINVYLIRSFHIETHLILHIRVHLTNLALRKKKAKASPYSHTLCMEFDNDKHYYSKLLTHTHTRLRSRSCLSHENFFL